jgi:hypothetical protein
MYGEDKDERGERSSLHWSATKLGHNAGQDMQEQRSAKAYEKKNSAPPSLLGQEADSPALVLAGLGPPSN